jgi:sialate O-acetylesterase
VKRVISYQFLVIGLIGLIGLVQARADVRPHGLFCENAVLQQGMPVPVWGAAAEGEKVTVEFQDQSVSTTASSGQWKVTLKPLKAGGPFTLKISGANRLTFTNVLVGEVWVISGQSNAAQGLGDCLGAEEHKKKADDPQLRLFQFPWKSPRSPERDVAGRWNASTAYWAHMFSGVGYFMGRDLRRALQVPVGLIQSAVGGTHAEHWTPRPYLAADPLLKPLLDKYPQELQRYEAALAKYQQDGERGTPPPNPEDDTRRRTSGLYNAMIAPLQPFAIRGVAWYQGENDAGYAWLYRTILPTMIRSWRETWGQGNFPFLIVQLAPYADTNCCGDSAWAELCESQLHTSQTVTNTALVVITDTADEIKNIHPRNKEPVGERLAIAARGVAYGEKIEYSGPIYKTMQIEGDRVMLSFTHVGGGLVSKDGPLKGFTVCGEDRKFVPAQAEIQGDKIVVRSEQVAKPVAVRFGWASYPIVNLFNKEGLPASPFRTDDFPMSTQPKQP